MTEQEIIKRIEALEKRMDVLENKNKTKPLSSLVYVFQDKRKNHSELLQELIQSDFCYSKNGLTKEEILEIFRENGRPVVSKKITDLLNKWTQRKKIEMIKKYGKSKYFWIENEKSNTSN